MNRSVADQDVSTAGAQEAHSHTLARNPFPGPGPYATDEHSVFFGREAEVEKLVSFVLATSVVVVDAPSGFGKSSLISAGLIPALDDYGVLTIADVRLGGRKSPGTKDDLTENSEIHSADRANPYIDLVRDEILLAQPSLDATRDLGELLGRARINKDARLVVLVLDQFEEIFGEEDSTWEETRDFLQQMTDIVNADGAIRIVIGLRNDYLANLLAFDREFPAELRRRFPLEGLDTETAKYAVRTAFEKSGVAITEARIRWILNTLTNSVARSKGPFVPERYVSLIPLQILCRQLWKQLALNADAPAWDEESGRLDDIMRDFVDQAIKSVVSSTKADERIVRRWLQDELIGRGDRRVSVPAPDDKMGLSSSIVAKLNEVKLIQLENRRGSHYAELTHDTMVPALLRSNSEWMRSALRKNRLVSILLVCVLVPLGWLLGNLRADPNPGLIASGDGFLQSSTKQIGFTGAQDVTTFIEVDYRPNTQGAGTDIQPTALNLTIEVSELDSAGAVSKPLFQRIEKTAGQQFIFVNTADDKTYAISLVGGPEDLTYHVTVRQAPLVSHALVDSSTTSDTIAIDDPRGASVLLPPESIFQVTSPTPAASLSSLDPQGAKKIDQSSERVILQTEEGGAVWFPADQGVEQLTFERIDLANPLTVGTTVSVSDLPSSVVPVSVDEDQLPLSISTDCQSVQDVQVLGPQASGSGRLNVIPAESGTSTTTQINQAGLFYVVLDVPESCNVRWDPASDPPISSPGRYTYQLPPGGPYATSVRLELPNDSVVVGPGTTGKDAPGFSPIYFDVRCGDGNGAANSGSPARFLGYLRGGVPCALIVTRPGNATEAMTAEIVVVDAGGGG
jgi:hypothetical protein